MGGRSLPHLRAREIHISYANDDQRTVASPDALPPWSQPGTSDTNPLPSRVPDLMRADPDGTRTDFA